MKGYHLSLAHVTSLLSKIVVSAQIYYLSNCFLLEYHKDEKRSTNLIECQKGPYLALTGMKSWLTRGPRKPYGLNPWLEIWLEIEFYERQKKT